MLIVTFSYGAHIQIVYPSVYPSNKKGLPTNGNPLNHMARPDGVEPPTAWFVARIQTLSLFINQSLAVFAQPIP